MIRVQVWCIRLLGGENDVSLSLRVVAVREGYSCRYLSIAHGLSGKKLIMEIWVDHANNSLGLHCFLQVPEYQPSTCPWGDGVRVSVSLINCWQMSRTCLSPQLSVHSPSVSNEASCQCLNVLSCFMYMYECFLCCNLEIAFQFCAHTGVIHCLYACHKSDLQKLHRQFCAS